MLEGVRGTHHIAVSVPDLGEAEAFYCGLLGFEVVDRYDFDPTPEGDAVLALKAAAARSILIRAGNVHLEVFEFSSPRPQMPGTRRPVSDIGYTHIALDVVGVDDVYERLKAAGVEFHSPPQSSLEEDGVRLAYGRDPFGNVIEIQEVRPDNVWTLGNALAAMNKS